MEKFQTLARRYFPIILMLLFAMSFLYKSDLSLDQDLGRHLKLGEIIWQTKQIPKINLFSYVTPDSPFINHHWLFEVEAYLLNGLTGLEFLLTLKVAILLICIGITLYLAMQSKSVLLITISFIFIHLMRERTDLRPEILSFLFTSLTLFILYKFEKTGSKLIYILPVISLIWVNSHIYFPIGIFLQIVFLGELLYKKFIQKHKDKELSQKIKIQSVVLCLSVLCLLINPDFWQGAIYPFYVLNTLGATTTENQSIFVLQSGGFKDPDFLFFYLSATITLLSIIIGYFIAKLTFKNFGLAFLGLILAAQTIREFPFLFLISLPAVLENFNLKIDAVFFKKNFWLTRSLNISVAILIIFEAFFYLSGNYQMMTYQMNSANLIVEENGKDALDFVIKNHLPQPIFNDFDIGSYVIYRGYPEYKVFVDGRPEAYPSDFFDTLSNPIQEDYSFFLTQQKKFNFQTIIFSIIDQNPRTVHFLGLVTKDKDWQTVYLDKNMIVLVRTDIQKQLNLPTTNLANLSANDFNYSNFLAYTNLSALLFNTQNYQAAQKINQKALELAPNNPAANYTMAYILLREGADIKTIRPYLDKDKNFVFW